MQIQAPAARTELLTTLTIPPHAMALTLVGAIAGNVDR